MKRIKLISIIIASVIAVIAPFVGVLVYAVSSEPVYSKTFVGALDEKIERLDGIKEEKIVVIGGSSVAFGIDSAMIEKYTGMPVVNFGLYAALGTKLMLDLSLDGIKKGDIVLIAPEIDAQTFSLYFNTETTLQALDGNMKYLSRIKSENFFPLLSGMWRLSKNKYKVHSSGAPIEPKGVYASENFNEYGDVVWERKENVMSLYYDPNVMITPDPSIVSEDFIEYLNEYIAKVKRKGAKVYYAFSPMNELGLAEGSDEASRNEFSDFVEDRINCELLGKINDYVYDAGYFYDTNFHLNDSGVVMHTVNILHSLLLELGIPTFVNEKVPEPPPLPELDTRYFEEDENAKYFTYEKLGNGTYKITGLSELAIGMDALTVPLGYDTYKVSSIGSGALSGSDIKKLIIPDNTNIRIIETGAFDGAARLSELWIYHQTASDILPPAYFDFSSLAEGFAVHVPPDSYYDSDYYWSERNLVFIKDAIK